MMIPYVVAGKEYNSLSALASAYDIPYSMLYNTVCRRKHLSIEEVIEHCLALESKRRRTLVVFGRSHQSLSAIAEFYGISATPLRYALDSNTSLEEAVINSLKAGVAYRGVLYPNMAVLTSTARVPYPRVMSRIRAGWSLADSIEQPPKLVSGKATPTTIRGTTYATIQEGLSRNGYDPKLIRYLTKRYAFDDFVDCLEWVDAFVSRYQGDRPSEITKIPYVIYNGVWFRTYAEFFAFCGLPHVKIDLHSKCTPLENMQRYKNMKTKLYLINGVWLPSLEAKVALGLSSFPSSIVRKDVVTHPTCTFNPTGYCADILPEWKAYLAKRIKSLAKR